MKSGRLGIFLVGVLGSIATTLIAGIWAAQKGIAPIRGAITETELTASMSLISLDNIYFAGWDIRESDCFSSAVENQVVSLTVLEKIKEELEKVTVYQGLNTNLDNVTRQVYGVCQKAKNEWPVERERLREHLQDFKRKCQLDYVVVVNVPSTEPPVDQQLFEWDLSALEKALEESDNRLAPSIIYCYIALQEECGFINSTPNTCSELPALQELVFNRGVPLAGKDGKTGQTLYKTVLAPMFKARDLQIKG